MCVCVCVCKQYIIKIYLLFLLFFSFNFIIFGCGQNLATNTLKHLMELEERILPTD